MTKLQTCLSKCAAGNRHTEDQARKIAASIKRRKGHPVEAFACKICGGWHTGKRRVRR